MWREIFIKDVHCCIIYNRENWKQPKYPIIEDWLNKLWYIDMIEYLITFKITFWRLFHIVGKLSNRLLS